MIYILKMYNLLNISMKILKMFIDLKKNSLNLNFLLGLRLRSLLGLLLLLHLLLLLLPFSSPQLLPPPVNTDQFTLDHVVSLSKVLDFLPQKVNPLIGMCTLICGLF